MTEPAVLHGVFGEYPHTLPLRDGEMTSDRVRLEVDLVDPVHKAFAPMVRREAYDISELAVVTALQAFAYDRPVVLLPAVMASRFQRGCLISHASWPIDDPRNLVGARIGVRSYSQTTGMWVREHLAEDVDLWPDQSRWITSDLGHVEEYRDPEFVTHVEPGYDLVRALRGGEVDAVILGNDLPSGDEFVPVIADADAKDVTWWEKHGFMPVNHVVVASKSLVDRDPEAVRAAYELLERADATVDRPEGSPVPTRFGIEQLLEPLEVVIAACHGQGLLPRRLSADEVLAPARQLLGR